MTQVNTTAERPTDPPAKKKMPGLYVKMYQKSPLLAYNLIRCYSITMYFYTIGSSPTRDSIIIILDVSTIRLQHCGDISIISQVSENTYYNIIIKTWVAHAQHTQ